MTQNPNNYPYGPDPMNPNYPGQPGQPVPNTGYGGQYAPPPPPMYPSGDSTPNSGYGPYSPTYLSNPQTPPMPGANPLSGPYDPTVASQAGSSPYGPPSSGGYPPYGAGVPSNPGYPSYTTPANPPFNVPPSVPPLPSTPPTRKKSSGLTIFIVVVALLIVVGGVLGIVFYNNHQTEVHNANSTATANTLNINATATANVQATATYVATHYPFSTNQVLSDPLKDNSNGTKYGWETNSFCSFASGAYQVLDDQANTFGDCAAQNTNYANFTYEVQMSVKSGDPDAQGGVFFRSDPNAGKYYLFYLGIDGSYELDVRTSNNAGGGSSLRSGTVSGYTTGLFQLHTIGVVANGPQITIYVDQNQILQVSNSSFSSGQIGVIASTGSNVTKPVIAAYTNAKVWQLPS